ncbi:hypothetical protein EMN47_18940 [Prolixibacteraceae bacterium JC049]|nr:hypothetical protein [Prolixibacteraceae bacterium JC049]
MKKILITVTLFISLLSPINLLAQLEFRNITFQQAVQQAQKEKKLVFVHIVCRYPLANQTANRAFNNPKLSELYSNFVCIKVAPSSDEFFEICNKYNILPIYPTSIFTDSQGNFLDIMYDKTTSRPDVYMTLATQAIENQANPPLTEMKLQYENGNLKKNFLKQYIATRSKYNLDIDELLEQYIDHLTVEEFSSKQEINFIIQCCPKVNSRAARLIRFDSQLFDSIFMDIPIKERKRINSKIIALSRKDAILHKNEAYMKNVADFAFSTYNDYSKAKRAANYQMLLFYELTNDSSHYKISALNYYNDYFAKVNLDSLGKKQSLWHANQINRLAWNIRKYTSNKKELETILKWTERILPYKNHIYYYTYALILIRLNKKIEAIKWQKKAIELAKQNKYPTNNLEKVLNNMQVGKI